MSAKVLITGGAGFIGLHLAECLLDNGCRVDLVDNFSRGVRDEELERLAGSPRARLLTADLLEPETFESFDKDYDYIYHFAALIGVVHILNRPYEVLRDNVALLVNALGFAKKQKGLKRFVFASTSEVYAGTLKLFSLPIPTPETAPLALTDLGHPRTSYMLSKIYGEALCRHSGVPFTVIRPHNIYGPRMGMAHVIPEIAKRAFDTPEGGRLEVFSLEHKRTFCYVADAVELIRLVAQAPQAENETLNIGSQGPEISVAELVELILDTMGKNLKIVGKPATPGSPARRCPDMRKTQKLAGYQAKVGLAQGIKLTYDWYKDNVFEGGRECAE